MAEFEDGDLLPPPPPKRNVSNGDEGFLPLPPAKKKTDIGNGVNNGTPSSVNGLGSFQNSLPNTNTSLDFSPVTDNTERQRLQQRDNDIRAKRQAEQQRLSKQIQSQLSAYDKAHPDNKQTAEQIASVGAYYQSKDKLRQPTEEELAHEKFMDTTVGKILAPVAYLGSKATKGTNQILRGAAYLANRANLQGAMDLATGANPDALTNPALDVLDEEANYGLTKNDVSHLEESKVLTNLGGLAEFLPTMAGAASTGGSTYYLQSWGAAQEMMDKQEKNGVKVNPWVREGFILGTGVVNGYLMKILGDGVFGKTPSALRNNIAATISADALKQVAGKELTGAEFKSLLESGADKFADRLSKFGLEAIKGYNKATVDLSALAGANFALKKGADIANDQPIFNESVGDLAEQVAHVATEAAPFFAAAGAIPNAGRLVRYNKDRNSVIESIMNDSSPENIDRIKQDLYNEGFNREADQWTPEEMDATFKQVDNIANVAKRLPKNIATDKLESAVDLIQGKEELQRRVADLQAARNEFDDSVKDIPTPEEQLLTDKVEQANDKLRDITTGNRTTYSKGTGEEEGKFYKTTNGIKEEISPSRYELEGLEREARVEDNKPVETVTEEEQNNFIKDEVDKHGVYYRNGERGDLKTDGQSIIFETQDKIYELGNVDELSSKKLSEFGIEKEVPLDVQFKGENGISIEGKDYYNNYSNQEAAINYDKDGNVISINLETSDGEKRTFRGQRAEEIAYQYKLKSFIENATEESIDRAIEQADQIISAKREIKSIITKRKIKDIEQSGTSKKIINDQRTETPVPEETIQPTQEQPIEAETNRTEVAKDSPTEPIEAVEATKSTEQTNTTTETKSSPTESINEPNAKTTDARNVTIDEISKKYGLEIKLNDGKRSRDLVESEANEKLKGGFDVNELVEKINTDKYQATDTETVVLAKHIAANEARVDAINEQLAKEGATIPKQTFDALTEEKNRLANGFQESATALKATKRANARALNSAKFIVQNDWSLGAMIEKKRRESNNGQRLKPDQIEDVQAKYEAMQKKQKEYEAKQAELQGKITELEAENRGLKGEQSFQKLKREGALEERRAKRKLTQEQLDKELNDSVDAMLKIARKSLSNLSANPIPVEVLPELAKAVKLLSKKGATTIADVADVLYTKLKDEIEGLTKDHVIEAIGNISTESTSTKDPLAAYKSRIKSNINKVRTKTEERDFTPTVRKALKLDEEAVNLRDDLYKMRDNYELELERDRLNNRTPFQKYTDVVVDVANAPRALMSSADFSAPLRQGAILGASHPRIAAEAMREMIKFTKSQKDFDRWFYDLKDSDDFNIINESKLYVSNPHKPKLTAREEQFMSNLAEKIPYYSKYVIKPTERAYIGYLNKLRVDVFRQAKDALEREGKTFESHPEIYKGLAKWINNATGRGSLGKFESSAGLLSIPFFSPRFLVSRINIFLNPLFYKSLPREVQRMAFKDMTSYFAYGASLMALAYYAGAQVGVNPLSTDFGKIRVGNTRYDLWGGASPIVRTLAQVMSGYKYKEDKGKYEELNSKKPFSDTRLGVVTDFFRNKLSPTVGYGVNALAGKTAIGEEFDPTVEAAKMVLPLVWQDFYKGARDEGFVGAAKVTPGLLGIGVQNYEAGIKPKEYKTSDRIALGDNKYTLTESQLADRGKINQEFIQKYGKQLRPSYESQVENSKEYKNLKKLVPYWKEKGYDKTYMDKQLKTAKENLVNKKIQRAADKYSKGKLIQKYYDPKTNSLDLELSEE